MRLVTIVGPGGIGKTRLSLAAAERAVNFPDGVYFVPLAPIESAANIVSAIAKTLDYRFFGEREPWRQILAYLAHKRMLLLMDNFEHLLDDGAALVAEMIQEAPAVKLLTTSRERLHLTGEAVYRIAGLPYPEDPAGPVTAENLKQYGAVALLLQQARLMRPAREPDAAELLEVARVCRLVQGMPLAIILAAGWLEMLSFKEIGDEIVSNLDILESENRDLPSRQRSVHAAFAYSWQRLSPDEQAAFMKLSVFHGGFSRRAAGEIAGASLRLLRALVEKSLLVSLRPERYEVHELLRQFAAEKLAESGAELETRTAHSAYYLRALADLELDIKGRRQVEAVAEIDADLDNVRAAWIWAVRQRMERSVAEALEALYLHFFIRGRYQDGAALLHLARGAWEEPQGNMFLARIIAREFWLRTLPLTDDPQFEPDLNTSLEVAQTHGDQFEAAFATFAKGYYHSRVRGDDEAAIPFFEASRAQFELLGDDFYLAWALVRLGYAESNVAGRRDASLEHTRQGLVLARGTGNKMQVAWASMNLAGFLLNEGDFRGSEGLYNEASSVAAETGFTPILPQVHLKLGMLHLLHHGDLAQARTLAIDTLRSARESGSPLFQAYALATLALEAGLSGDHARALRLGQESLEHPSNPRAEWNAHWAMSIANCGLERVASARRELLHSLRRTIDFQWQGLMIRLLPVAALLEYRAGRDSRAVELLSLAMHHPLSATGWIEVWALVADMRAELERKLEADFLPAWERGKELDLETTSGELLARYSE